MAFSGNYICTSFKVECLKGVHNFTSGTGHTFKLALYTNSASFTAATTAYTTSNEITGTGYSAGGLALTTTTPSSSGTTALLTFSTATWPSATFTARGGLIYNSSAVGNPTVAVLDFGSDRTVSGASFVVTFPTADATSAIIRFV